MTDVLLKHESDGGNIEATNGVVAMTDAVETSTYLSLFGGNISDSGLPHHDHVQWWGNIGIADESQRYRSQTQHLLGTIPASTGNLKRIKDAVVSDLAWMIGVVATTVSASVSLVAVNRVRIAVNIEADGSSSSIEYLQAWEASS